MLIGLAGLLCAATASAQVSNPIALPDAPWAFDGFAIKAPRDGQWLSFFKSRDRVVFVRADAPQDDTLIAVAVALQDSHTYPDREAFLQSVRTERDQAVSNEQYRLISHQEELEPDGALWCTRYTLHGEEQRSFWTAAWMIDIKGRSCWHPEAGLRIDLSLTERSLINQSSSTLETSNLAFLRTLRLYPHRTTAGAEQSLLQQAETGDPFAALRLAQGYQQQGRAAADFLYWYRFAAERGEADAQYNLGVYYDQAPGAERNVALALHWFKRAADQRDIQAQLNLGILYYKGEGMPSDKAQAQYWLGLAALNGNARARQLLIDLDFEAPAAAAKPGSTDRPTQRSDETAAKPEVADQPERRSDEASVTVRPADQPAQQTSEAAEKPEPPDQPAQPGETLASPDSSM